jgi:hypothetical protein
MKFNNIKDMYFYDIMSAQHRRHQKLSWVTAQNWVQEDYTACRYPRNQCFIRPIEIEMTSPPAQPIQAPPPAAWVAKKDSRLFARGTIPPGPKPSVHEDLSPSQPRSILSGPQRRIGEWVRMKVIRFEAGEEKKNNGKVGCPR